MNRYNATHPCDGMLLINKEEPTTDSWNNTMDLKNAVPSKRLQTPQKKIHSGWFHWHKTLKWSNSSTLTESRSVVNLGQRVWVKEGKWLRRHCRELWKWRRMFYTLTGLVVTQMHIFTKIHWTIHLKGMHLFCINYTSIKWNFEN